MKSTHKYLPVNEAQRSWGLYATCVGHSRTAPRAEFPVSSHPDEYFFSWDKGRILREWQISLIEDGKGTVEFRHKRHSVRKGSLIVLPPGCWHRYRPQKNIGWTTLWIGFGGDLADRLVGGAGFGKDGEVLYLPNAHRFHRSLKDMVDEILESPKDNTYSTAARIPALVAALMEELSDAAEGVPYAELVRRAQTHIAEHATEIVDFEELSASFGLPYRTFRHVFGKETGTSPHQYQLEIRLARAKNLLRSTEMPVAEIAETLGFNSTWYFSHFFRKRVRTSPAAYRKRHRQ